MLLKADADLDVGEAISENGSLARAAGGAGGTAPGDDGNLLHIVDKSNWISGEDLFYILFTSGSTGEPKGVEITAFCHDHFLPWALELIGEGGPCAQDARGPKVFLNQAPFSFDLSVYELTQALASGGTLFSLTKSIQSSFTDMFASFKDAGINVWVSTPSFADLCLADKSFDDSVLPCINTFLFCGETLLAQTAANLYARFPGCEVINTYGPTESTVAVASVRITSEHINANKPLPVGKAKPGCELKIDRDTGEITIIGDTVAKGYFNKPDMTEKSFGVVAKSTNGASMSAIAQGKSFGDERIDVPQGGLRFYRTGDSGTLDANGMLYFGGRLDFQVKLNGYRIELGDIEENLRGINGVANAIVLAVEQDGKVSHLVACVMRDKSYADGDTDMTDFKYGLKLKKELALELPTYMVPKTFRFFDAFPLTNNGKADRKALATMI
jgi:D-alanine--poly(phosphoribitol) ligase subunit 1